MFPSSSRRNAFMSGYRFQAYRLTFSTWLEARFLIVASWASFRMWSTLQATLVRKLVLCPMPFASLSRS